MRRRRQRVPGWHQDSCRQLRPCLQPMDRRWHATRRFPENLPGENPRSPSPPRTCVFACISRSGRDDDGMTTTDRHRLLSFLGPNWFASVMGTGIVATAGATLPLHVPGLRAFALAVWVAASVWLVILIVAVIAHWVRNPTVARSHAYNPQMD